MLNVTSLTHAKVHPERRFGKKAKERSGNLAMSWRGKSFILKHY
jgi:hypothetical protein